VGRALMGRRAGDYVEVTVHGETREWQLMEVS
jgi:transcription elongation GreA/GreB family factor